MSPEKKCAGGGGERQGKLDTTEHRLNAWRTGEKHARLLALSFSHKSEIRSKWIFLFEQGLKEPH